MRRGEIRFTSGCVPEAGSSGTKGRCLLCGDEWEEENCCGKMPCVCQAMAETWHDISYKNVILYIAHLLGYLPNLVYDHFWEKWHS